jgi:hypothetical protein
MVLAEYVVIREYVIAQPIVNIEEFPETVVQVEPLEE